MTAALVTAEVHAPSISYHLVAPMLIVLGAALLGVLVEAFAPRRARYVIQVPLTLAALVAAFVAVILASGHTKATTAAGAVVVDGPALFFQGTILVLATLAVLTMAERFEIAIQPTPFRLPKLREIAQFHKARAADEGLRWLRQKLREVGENIR